MFSLNDLRISFPHAEIERVPLSELGGVVGAVDDVAIIVGVGSNLGTELEAKELDNVCIFNERLRIGCKRGYIHAGSRLSE